MKKQQPRQRKQKLRKPKKQAQGKLWRRGQDYRTDTTPCPGCGVRLSGAMATERCDREGRPVRPKLASAPDQGDFTICAYCGTVMVYYESGGILRLRAVTQAEREGEAAVVIRHLEEVWRRRVDAIGPAPAPPAEQRSSEIEALL